MQRTGLPIMLSAICTRQPQAGQATNSGMASRITRAERGGQGAAPNPVSILYNAPPGRGRSQPLAQQPAKLGLGHRLEADAVAGAQRKVAIGHIDEL